jgi:hypothetical protein
MLRRHCRILVNLGGGDNQETLLAVARHDHFAVFAAFEERIQACQLKTGLGAVLAMAPSA